MKTKHAITAVFLGLMIFGVSAVGQTTAFTYQGRLTDTSMPPSGTYQMNFALYDAVTGGTQIGGMENPAVAVSNGVFTVELDYGATAFPGAERYLEISVRRTSADSYVVLNPRQRVTSAPYAVRAANAGNASNLGGTAATNFVQTSDPRLSDARPASSVNFGTATITGVLPVPKGGTGSSTQNFVDLTTDQDVGGNKNFTGVIRGNGSNLTGTIQVLAFAGFVNPIAPSSSAYVFAGPTATVTVAAGQRLTGTASAALARTVANPQTVDLGLCYGSSNFAGSNYITVQVLVTRHTYTASSSVNPPPGTYNVGFCVRNNSSGALDNNDFVNGWVMVSRY